MEETDGRSGMVPVLVALHDCALLTLPLVALQNRTTVGLQRAHVTPMLKNNLLYKFHKHTHTTLLRICSTKRGVCVCVCGLNACLRGEGEGRARGGGGKSCDADSPSFA